MSKGDLVRLRHMLDAVRDAIGFVRGRKRRDLDADRMFALALVKCIEIVGEAASGMSKEFQLKHSSIPWTEVIGMRHRLVHGYFAVDMDRVWDTVSVDLPRLAIELETIHSTVGEEPKV